KFVIMFFSSFYTYNQNSNDEQDEYVDVIHYDDLEIQEN
ncbi:RNA chaperone Hfq, partial [Francisella tularensis subsp. holarctica]|nr:RNA chaperone Hfq [Francisella tularensis subsp. holarctica]